MLERLLENWLINVSEREFDIPFRLLLEQMGYVSFGHTTIHGLSELGKDVVATNKSTGITYFFQVKSGDANLEDWNDMERQMRQMVAVPYIHPNYALGDPYQPVWVLTGQMDEAVRLSLGRANDLNRLESRPSVEVWDRNMLIEFFKNSIFDLPVSNDLLVLDFIRLWSRLRSYMSDEVEVREFFRTYLRQNSSSTQRRQRKLIATFTIIVAQFSQRYLALNDIYSAIDVTVLGITVFFEYIVQLNLTHRIYAATLEYFNDYVYRLLAYFSETLEEDSDLLEDLFDNTEFDFTEAIQLPLRVHSLTSKLALLILLKANRNEDFAKESEFLRLTLANNSGFTHVFSERQMSTFWIVCIALLRLGNSQLVTELIEETFDQLLQFHTLGERGLLSPYESFEKSVKHLLDFTISQEDAEHNRSGHSYFLPILMKLACLLNFRDPVAEQWHTISDMGLVDPRPQTLEALFAPDSEDVHIPVIRMPITGSWSLLQQWFQERLPPLFNPILDKHPEALLYLTLAYPWRTQWRETERYTVANSNTRRRRSRVRQ